MPPHETESADAPPRLLAMREIAAIIAGTILATVWLNLSSRGSETRFEDLALGEGTSTFYAAIGDYPIHCNDLDDGARCIAGFRARRGSRVALWLGNSQLHAVNQLKPGQVTASAILSEKMQDDGIDLLTFSQPNANLQEHLVFFVYLARSLPIERLILAVVFDDLRETGIRPSLLPALRDPETRAALQDIEIGRTILEQNRDTAEGDFAALDQTAQEFVEMSLNDWLDEHFRLWAARPEMRGRLFANLHQYRNAALGITAQTKRKVIRGRYQLNMAALDAILASASQSGIESLVYIVPLRNDVEAPYDEDEYAVFKREVEDLSARHGAVYANLESTVPGEFWGMKDSTDGSGELEFDFMHFQAPGHARLAAAIGDVIAVRANGDPK